MGDSLVQHAAPGGQAGGINRPLEQVPVELFDETLVRGADVIRQVAGNSEIGSVAHLRYAGSHDFTVGLNHDRGAKSRVAAEIRCGHTTGAKSRINGAVR